MDAKSYGDHNLDDLPEFIPFDDLPVISPQEVAPCPPRDPALVLAESSCEVGDELIALHRIEELRRTGLDLGHFRGCFDKAIQSRSEKIVQALLDQGMLITGDTIRDAIEQKNTAILALLQLNGWDINSTEAWYFPPSLHRAIARYPDPDFITWFLDHGANPNAYCDITITPLSIAVEVAPLPIVKQLLDHCPPTTEFSGHLLHFAARRLVQDAGDVVQLVLDRCRPNLNAIMWDDCPFAYVSWQMGGLGTALHEAAKGGQAVVAEMLLRAGVIASIRDSLGRTALQVAEEAQNEPVIKVLRSAEPIPRL